MADDAPGGVLAGTVFAEAARLHRDGRIEDAVAAYGRVLALDPDHRDALNNIGVALRISGRFQAAAAALARAVALDPDSAAAHGNLGNALRALGRLEQAETAHRRALALQPNHAGAHYNLALGLRDQGRLDEAIAGLRRAVELDPEAVNPRWDLALALLLSGDLAAGFEAYEARMGLTENTYPDLPMPRWDGGALDGPLLIQAEQGLGDTLQFARYAALVAERFAVPHTLLRAPPSLVEVLKTLPGDVEVVADGGAPPAAAAHIPLLSLPRLFGETLDAIADAGPYLRAPDHGPDLPAPPGVGLRVALAWAGRPSHRNDRNRSLALADMLRVCAVPGVAFYSLQLGPGRGQMGPAGGHALLTDLAPLVRSFADTARLLDQLDLLITVDTAVAHLAGAMGRPAWVLLPFAPDWRWLLGRAVSPWRPSLRLFRQPRPGDWDSVLGQIVAALSALAARNAAKTP